MSFNWSSGSRSLTHLEYPFLLINKYGIRYDKGLKDIIRRASEDDCVVIDPEDIIRNYQQIEKAKSSDENKEMKIDNLEYVNKIINKILKEYIEEGVEDLCKARDEDRRNPSTESIQIKREK